MQKHRLKSDFKFQISNFKFPAILFMLYVIFPVIPLEAASYPSSQITRSPDRQIITEEWAMRLKLGEDPDNLAKSSGAENLGQIGRLPHTYLFRIPGTRTRDKSLTAKARLEKETRIQWYEQQVARWRFPRDIEMPHDPLFSDQWHLKNTGQSGAKAGEDINVMPAWDQGFTGQGVVIGIVDDGLQYEHPDLSPNYRKDLSYDFNSGDSDPAPSYYDKHGTSAAGVAAARDNDTCGVGSAYRAGLAGLRLIAFENTDADEAEALSYQYENIHIYSNSWGPDDDAMRLEGPGPLALEVLEDGIRNGRGGLGSIYIWAAGNGLSRGDNINYDGYANSRFTIAVGAVDHKGIQASYSEPGAAMLVTAPSDSGYAGGITTTDLLGSQGYDSGDCRDDFGGTSASAPLAAGVAALMLEANPNLSWRDVQHILVKTAVRNDPGDEDWILNGGGLYVNHKYGFGRIDAAAATAMAASWQGTPDASAVSYGPEIVSQSVPDNDTDGVASSIIVDQNLRLEHVEAVFSAEHSDRGHLQVILTSPSGTQSVLAEPHRDKDTDYDAWKFMSVHHWDEVSQGEWVLTVSDLTDGTEGVYDSWELILHGTHGPLARDDAAFFFADKGTPVIIDVLSNDSHTDGDALTVTDVTAPVHGTALLNTDNTITYTPENGFTGADIFTYISSDGKNGSDTANVSITVASEFALSFDGRDDSVDCGKGETLNLIGALTIEAWIRPSGWGARTDSGGYGRVVDKEKFILYLNSVNTDYNDHSLVFAMEHSDGDFAAVNTPANSIELDIWQHLAATYDGTGQVRIYINGREQLLDQPYDPPSGPVSDNKEFSLFIGQSANHDRAFEGVADEVRLWNAARSSEEIQSALHVSLTGNEKGLVGYWPMDPPGDILGDQSGNGNDGTIFGATWCEGVSSDLPKAILILKVLAGMNVADVNTVKNIRNDGKFTMVDVIRILQKSW